MERKGQQRLDAALWVLLSAAMLLALYMALLQAPRERTMGDVQRIFYFHVPAGIAGLSAFAVNFAASLMYLLRKDRRWDHVALAAAETGMVLMAIVLVTGPIWAKYAWLVWWTWSPRLTSSLVLWLLYAAYLLTRNYIADPERKAFVSAVFGIVAFVDAPLVWFSIRWWRDLHPSPMLETGGLAPEMRPALWVCIAAYMLLLVFLVRRRYYLECARRDVELLMRRVDP